MLIPLIVAHGEGALVLLLAGMTGTVSLLLAGTFYFAHWLVNLRSPSSQRGTEEGLRQVLGSSVVSIGVNFALSVVWLETGWTVWGRVEDDLAMFGGLLAPSLLIGGLVFWWLGRESRMSRSGLAGGQRE